MNETEPMESQNMSQYYVLGFVVLVGVVIAGYLLRSKSSPATPSPVADSVPTATPTPGPITGLACDLQYYNPVIGFPKYYLSVEGGDVSKASKVDCTFTASVDNKTVHTTKTSSPLTEKPLEKYTINRLSGRVFDGSQIVLDQATATTSAYTSYNFHYMSDGKKVTGLAHIPRDASETNKKPVIVQFRGYIDAATYFSGAGTQHSAEVYAQHGFISLAPDFLGYGGSDQPSTDVFEERFETYTAALNLLASVHTLPPADAARVGIWGHSNGGQIALTALEASHRVYPASLWAPVSKPFPYSILYYTDDADDHGKALRRRLAAFEHEYDVEQYSLTNYIDRIAGPLQIHQGSADEAVPQKWTDTFVEVLRKNGPQGKPREDADLQYFVYPGSDHDMKGSWNTVVSRDIQFFQTHLP